MVEDSLPVPVVINGENDMVILFGFDEETVRGEALIVESLSLMVKVMHPLIVTLYGEQPQMTAISVDSASSTSMIVIARQTVCSPCIVWLYEITRSSSLVTLPDHSQNNIIVSDSAIMTGCGTTY